MSFDSLLGGSAQQETVGDLIPPDVRENYPDAAILPQFKGIMAIPVPKDLSPSDRQAIGQAIAQRLPQMSIPPEEVAAAYPGVDYATGAIRLAAFKAQPAIAQAGEQFVKGALEQLPSPRGLFTKMEQPEETTPQPLSEFQKVTRGVGGAATYGGEAGGAMLVGVPPPIAAALPAVLGPGGVRQRVAGGATMAATEGVLGSKLFVAPFEASLARKVATGAAGVGVLAGPSAWVQTAAQKALGDKDARWPTAKELAENLATLGILSVATHAMAYKSPREALNKIAATVPATGPSGAPAAAGGAPAAPLKPAEARAAGPRAAVIEVAKDLNHSRIRQMDGSRTELESYADRVAEMRPDRDAEGKPREATVQEWRAVAERAKAETLARTHVAETMEFPPGTTPRQKEIATQVSEPWGQHLQGATVTMRPPGGEGEDVHGVIDAIYRYPHVEDEFRVLVRDPQSGQEVPLRYKADEFTNALHFVEPATRVPREGGAVERPGGAAGGERAPDALSSGTTPEARLAQPIEGGRRFLSREEAVGSLGLHDAANIARLERRGAIPPDVRPAMRVGERVFEALPGEKLHSQMYMRLMRDPSIPEDIKSRLRTGAFEDGFTTRSEAEPRLARGPTPPPKPPKPGRIPGGMAIATMVGTKRLRPGRAARLPTEAEAEALPSATVPGGGPTIAKPGGILEGQERIRTMFREIAESVNPMHYVSPAAREALMARLKGPLEQFVFRNEQRMDYIRRWWETQPKEVIMDFLDRLEHGRPAAPGLEDMAKAYRERADNVFRAISNYKTIPYYRNWFPHLWANPDKAEQWLQSRRPIEGTKRFTHERFYADIRAGLEAGLKLKTWNPETMMQAMEHDARKFVAFQEFKVVARQLGLLKYVKLGAEIPDGYRTMNQKWTTVWLDPRTEIKEYYDREVMRALNDTVDKLGFKRMRPFGKLGRGMPESALGAEIGKGRKEIRTLFGTPEHVLAHELGHALDDTYGMYKVFTNAGSRVVDQVREISALRHEGVPATALTPESYQYIYSPSEMMATLLEAYIHMPERMKQIAPDAYDLLRDFLQSHPESRELADLKPSLWISHETRELHAGGGVIAGQWVAQEGLARVLDNYMSPDFITGTEAGKGLMASRNFINAMQLGFSAFHATGMTLLASFHEMTVGLGDLEHGLKTGDTGATLAALRKMAKAAIPGVAAAEYTRVGQRFYKNDPSLAGIENDVFAAGARLRRMDYYKNQMLDNFVTNMNIARTEANPAGERWSAGVKAAFQGPFAAVELPMRLLTEHFIPQLKIGAFRDEFASELRRQEKDLIAGKTTRFEIARRAWTNVEDRFGLLNYDNLFWNQNLKTAIMLLIRAPGWTLGTMRALGGASFIDLPRFASRVARGQPPEFTSRMRFALSMVVMSLGMGGVYHYLHTGKRPETLEDYLEPKNGAKDANGRDIRVTFPTYMKDVRGWSTDPIREAVGRIPARRGGSTLFHGGKLAPEATAIMDFLENQTYRGPIHNPNDPAYKQAEDMVKWFFGTLEPFSLQQYQKIKKGTAEERAESFLGITRAPQPSYQRRR